MYPSTVFGGFVVEWGRETPVISPDKSESPRLLLRYCSCVAAGSSGGSEAAENRRRAHPYRHYVMVPWHLCPFSEGRTGSGDTKRKRRGSRLWCLGRLETSITIIIQSYI